VLVIKCFNDNAVGTDVTFKDGVYEALDFAKSRPGVKLVINYSGEGPETNVREEAVQKALDEGALIVAPAGNGSAMDSIAFPAAYSTRFDNVMAVAGINSIRRRVPTSNQGPGLTVAAPGADIYSTMPNYFVQLNNAGLAYDYASMGGTSMAAAFVSGLAALVWSVCPGLTPAQVRDRIASTSDPVSAGVHELGRGIINAERALQGLKQSLCPDAEASAGEPDAPAPIQQG
jgi:subtilisin family serine protease